MYRLQLVSQTLKYSIVFQGLCTYLSFHLPSILFSGQPEQQSSQFGRFSSFTWLSLGLVVCPKLGDPFVSQNPKTVCSSLLLFHFFPSVSKWNSTGVWMTVFKGFQDPSGYSSHLDYNAVVWLVWILLIFNFSSRSLVHQLWLVSPSRTCFTLTTMIQSCTLATIPQGLLSVSSW